MAKSGKSGTSGAVHTTTKPGSTRWQNTVNGKVVSEHNKKSTAEAAGRSEAKERKTEHVVHGRDGQIQERNSYGNDPERRKG